MTSTVLLATTDPGLVERITQRLAGRCELRVVEEGASFSSESNDAPPSLTLFDLRDLMDGGHAADRRLDRYRSENADGAVLLLIDDFCPEIIERRAAVSKMVLVRDDESGELLIAAITDRLIRPSTKPRPAPPAEAPRVDRNDAVARRFETSSPTLRRMLDDLAVAALHNVTILLIGETGSGKTYLSNLIHEASPRREEPFLHVACGALPRDLIESELFGHVKGAFTSAHADKDGKFVAARSGTILLDEIDVLGPEQQVKLLRVIETGEFEPVGSNRTLKSQARLVVASNLDLQPLVEQGRFRPDLYYRLNMLKFELPPLRKRKIDVIPLAKKFIEKFADRHGVRIERIGDSLFDALVDYPWPGNVRELEHVIQRAVIYSRDGALTAEQLPPHILAGQIGPVNDPAVHLVARSAQRDPSLGRQVAMTEKEIIEQTLFKNNFSRTITARELGISRVTLYNKMKKYNMSRATGT